MMKIDNLTYGNLTFGDMIITSKGFGMVKDEEYNKIKKGVEYAASKRWCMVSEIPEEKKIEEVKIEKKKKED